MTTESLSSTQRPEHSSNDQSSDSIPQSEAGMELDSSIVMESQIRLHSHKRLIQITLESIESLNPLVLEFNFRPTLQTAFESFSPLTALLPDNPHLALKYGRPENDQVESYKSTLINVLHSLDEISIFDESVLLVMKQELQTLIMNGLSRIHSIKAIEWERQARKAFHSNQGEDAALFVSAEEYIAAYNRLHNLPRNLMLSLFLAVVLHTVCHLSRSRSNFVLSVLRCLQCFTCHRENDPLAKSRGLDRVPKDIRTAEAIFNISPALTKYISCIACRKLYHPNILDYRKGLPKTCDNQEYPGGTLCGTPLWKSHQIKGSPHNVPRMTFHAQDFPSWLGRFLSRPNIEDLIRKPIRWVSENTSPVYHRDIWDGKLVRSFEDNAGQPFFKYTGPELRLLFGIGYDGFNPFHIKAAGKKGTVAVVFLFCYNLPSDIRLRPENVFIAGVIPGPKHPSLTQINHYIQPLIDVFLKFYDPGFLIWGLPNHSDGLVAKGVMWPAVMDSLALRQMFGLGAIISTWLCFSCRIGADDIDSTTPEKWQTWHSPCDHRQLAEQWRLASTEVARNKLVAQTGIRWSEFCRLPYFDVTKMCIIDPMHSFQNLCRNLVTEVWGIDTTQPSGNGLFVGSRPTPSKPVTNIECYSVLQAIKENDSGALNRFRRYPLWHLCERHELRRAGEKVRPYRETLKTFYINNPDILKDDLTYFRAKSPNTTVGDPPLIRNIRLGLAMVSNENREETKRWLQGQLIQDLHSTCRERKIGYIGSESGAELAEILILHQLKTRTPVASSDLAKGLVVLGKDILVEIDKDIGRTILPSWVQPGPKTYDGLGHGKLSANEWRTHVVVRLAITLPRVWTNIDERHQAMLDNFMHLINAIIIASSRAVVSSYSDASPGQSTTELYRAEYLEYLRGRIKLYPTGKIQPTEHVAYHIASQWEEISPSHVTSTNQLERLNGMLQNINTNKRWSELEESMMTIFCTNANIKTLMEDALLFPSEGSIGEGESQEPSGRQYLREMREQFQEICGIEGGLMLSEVMDSPVVLRYAFPNQTDLQRKAKVSLERPVMELLIVYLRNKYNTETFTIPVFNQGNTENPSISLSSSIFLTENAWPLTECQFNGTWFRTAVPTSGVTTSPPDYHIPPHRDSYVWFSSAHSGYRTAGVIIDMFAYEHNIPKSSHPVFNTYLVVRRFTELEIQHQSHDSWRKYPISGGRLFYYRTDHAPEVIDIRDVYAHVAVTPFQAGEISHINHRCVHALPLIWHNMFRPYDFSSDTGNSSGK